MGQKVIRSECSLELKIAGDALKLPDWERAESVLVFADTVLEESYIRRYEFGGLSVVREFRDERRVTGWQLELSHWPPLHLTRRWVEVKERSVSGLTCPLQFEGWIEDAFESNGLLILRIRPG